MAWTVFEEEQLRYLKGQGVSHEKIARRLCKRTQEVCEKIAEQEFVICDCCKRNIPIDKTASYEMPNGEVVILCAVCGSVVDFVNSYQE